MYGTYIVPPITEGLKEQPSCTLHKLKSKKILHSKIIAPKHKVLISCDIVDMPLQVDIKRVASTCYQSSIYL